MINYRLVVLIITSLVVNGLYAFRGAGAEEIVISEGSPLYRDIMPLAIEWKEAIINKDMARILRRVHQDDIAYVEKSLYDKKSDLYKSLYDDEYVHNINSSKKSVYSILINMKKLKITLMAKEPIMLYGIRAYYYDEKDRQMNLPLSQDTNLRLWMKSYVMCGFVETDGKWWLSFWNQFLFDDY